MPRGTGRRMDVGTALSADTQWSWERGHWWCWCGIVGIACRAMTDQRLTTGGIVRAIVRHKLEHGLVHGRMALTIASALPSAAAARTTWVRDSGRGWVRSWRRVRAFTGRHDTHGCAGAAGRTWEWRQWWRTTGACTGSPLGNMWEATVLSLGAETRARTKGWSAQTKRIASVSRRRLAAIVILGINVLLKVVVVISTVEGRVVVIQGFVHVNLFHCGTVSRAMGLLDKHVQDTVPALELFLGGESKLKLFNSGHFPRDMDGKRPW